MRREAVEWMTSTPLSAFVLDYRWVWPISESLHFMALVLLVGTISLFDLRVLGLGKGIAPAAVHRLVPFGMAGFAVSIGTGTLFLFGQPDQYFYNSAFFFKVGFLALMGLNVAFFYMRPFRAIRTLAPHDDAPLVAKISAALSLAIMVGVMCAGRMLTFYRPPGFIFS
jgi:Family of unknown function (DUF6644)